MQQEGALQKFQKEQTKGIGRRYTLPGREGRSARLSARCGAHQAGHVCVKLQQGLESQGHEGIGVWPGSGGAGRRGMRELGHLAQSLAIATGIGPVDWLAHVLL